MDDDLDYSGQQEDRERCRRSDDSWATNGVIRNPLEKLVQHPEPSEIARTPIRLCLAESTVRSQVESSCQEALRAKGAPLDAIGSAIMIAKIATGEIEDGGRKQERRTREASEAAKPELPA